MVCTRPGNIEFEIRRNLLSAGDFTNFMAGNEVQVVVSATLADEVVETADVQFEGDIWVYPNG